MTLFNDSVRRIYSILYFRSDVVVFKARRLFFVGILGHYFGLSGVYYSDLCKNKNMIYFKRIVENENGKIAFSNILQFRKFVEENMDSECRILEIKKEKLKQIAYGKKSIKEYETNHETEQIPEIYKISSNLNEN